MHYALPSASPTPAFTPALTLAPPPPPPPTAAIMTMTTEKERERAQLRPQVPVRFVTTTPFPDLCFGVGPPWAGFRFRV